jgi:hypothetical protein
MVGGQLILGEENALACKLRYSSTKIVKIDHQCNGVVANLYKARTLVRYAHSLNIEVLNCLLGEPKQNLSSDHVGTSNARVTRDSFLQLRIYVRPVSGLFILLRVGSWLKRVWLKDICRRSPQTVPTNQAIEASTPFRV